MAHLSKVDEADIASPDTLPIITHIQSLCKTTWSTEDLQVIKAHFS